MGLEYINHENFRVKKNFRSNISDKFSILKNEFY